MFVAEYNHRWNRVPLPQVRVHPEPQNVTLFGNGLFIDVIKVRLNWIRAGPKSNGSVLTRGGEDTERHPDAQRRPCEDGARDWRDAATNQGTPGSSEAARGKGRSSPGAFRRGVAQITP